MPVFDYICPNCKEKKECFVKSIESTPKCENCGAEMKRLFSGKMYGATGQQSGACSGNCATCNKCKK